MTTPALQPVGPLPAGAGAPGPAPRGVQFGATRRGLRVAWLPAPGPVRARLAFRVGTVDERLPERGLTHLVAHLAHRFTDVGLEADGGRPERPWHRPCTSPLEVAFTASGSEAEVRARLIALCEGLASLGEVLPEEVAHEVGHLQDEADLRLPGSWDLLRTARHGLSGWGQLATAELAAPTADGTSLTRWVERWFTASNAVLSVAGPLPPGWVLPLLSGGSSPALALTAPPLSLPARVEGPPGSVGVTALAQDRAAVRAGWWWLHRLTLEELRRRGVVGTDVEVEVTAVGGDRVELALAVHTSADAAQDALHAVQDATARACSEPLPEPELDRWVSDLVATDPLTDLEDLARAWLLSGLAEPPAAPPHELLVDQARALRATDVLDALRVALGTGLLQVPRDVVAPAGLPLASGAEPGPLAGRTWVPAGGGPARLVIGEEGVQVRGEDGSAGTALWDGAVAVLHRPGGSRVVVSATGTEVEVDPSAWADGPTAVEVLDGHVPADLVVALVAPDGAPQPGAAGRRGRALAALRALATAPVRRPRAPRTALDG